MRFITMAATAVLLCGCAAFQKHANTRPMTAETMQAVGKAPVVVAQNNNGIEAEGVRSFHIAKSFAQGINMIHQQPSTSIQLIIFTARSGTTVAPICLITR